MLPQSFYRQREFVAADGKPMREMELDPQIPPAVEDTGNKLMETLAEAEEKVDELPWLTIVRAGKHHLTKAQWLVTFGDSEVTVDEAWGVVACDRSRIVVRKLPWMPKRRMLVVLNRAMVEDYFRMFVRNVQSFGTAEVYAEPYRQDIQQAYTSSVSPMMRNLMSVPLSGYRYGGRNQGRSMAANALRGMLIP
jgi:hypothetical protein